MIIPRGLTARVLAVAVLGALSTLPIVIVPVAQWGLQAALSNAFDPAMPLAKALGADCALSPASWSKKLPHTNVYGYDAASGQSLNPAAPTIDRTLYARLLAGEKTPSHLRWTFPLGGRIMTRAMAAGPCSVLVVTWSPPADARAVHLRMLIAIPVILMFVVGLAAILFAIRPVLRRIAVLDRAAAHIGDIDSFVAVDDPTDDALGRLAGRIADSHRRIVAANEALRQRAVALQEHLSDVAHDVRTPLAALQLRLEQLASGERDRVAVSSERQQHLLDSLEDVLYLTSLTENLRLASQLQETSAPNLEPLEVDVGPIVRRVVNRFDALGALRAVRVRGSFPDEPVLVRCEPASVEQALTNLVQNAVMHGRENGSVTVMLDRVGQRFELAVLDDGPGVAPETIPLLAERRFRGDDARSRGPTGSGLGLAIVAEVCARSDWSLDFETLQPRGLKVSICGPLSQSAR